jgi:pilus assembly protein Flp/PilA
MQNLKTLAGRLVSDTRGTTAIEYGLIAMLIAVGCIAGVRALGAGNSSSWGGTATKITDAMKR